MRTKEQIIKDHARITRKLHAENASARPVSARQKQKLTEFRTALRLDEDPEQETLFVFAHQKTA